ncbi:MAG: DUF2306 domain-containing protein [Gammaproteobacteria bacterium]|nr:DUF2306 domain-containing protein [Gammaproteobacteria bacterium]
MISLGALHLWFSYAALLTGLFVVLLRKGTRLHRSLGYAYVTSMLGVNATALMIYELFGHFGVFHYAAVLSLATLTAGMVPVLVRHKNWLQWHAYLITGSYAGLISAAVSESTRLPLISSFFVSVTSLFVETESVSRAAFWTAVGTASFVVTFIGVTLMTIYIPRAMKNMSRT